jgi:hypothetical protein
MGVVLKLGQQAMKYITIRNQYVTKCYTGLSTLMELINASNGKKTSHLAL